MTSSGGKTFRIAVLDDHSAFAEALCMAVNGAPGLACIGHAASITGCVDLALTELPDVFILDHRLLEGNGLQCARELRAAGVKSRLIMLTADASPALADQAAAAGITGGVLSKHTPLSEVLAAVRALAMASV